MHRLCGDSIMVGFVILSLLLAGAAYAKPWRNIELIPASRIKWIPNDSDLAEHDNPRCYP